MYYRVSGVWKSVIVRRTEIKSKPLSRMFDTANMPIGNTNIQIQINVSDFIISPSFT